MDKMIVPLTYKLMEHGVRRSDGACIPNCDDNRDWKEYQEWLAQGNVPEPQFTEQELIDQTQSEEIASLKQDLKNAMVWQFRMIAEIWKVLKLNTPATNSEIDPEVFAKAAEWMQKINRLKEIDE